MQHPVLRIAILGLAASIASQAAQRARTPGETTVLGTSTHLALGTQHTCHLGHEGRVRCWGGNNGHELDDGTNVYSSTRVYSLITNIPNPNPPAVADLGGLWPHLRDGLLRPGLLLGVQRLRPSQRRQQAE